MKINQMIRVCLLCLLLTVSVSPLMARTLADVDQLIYSKAAEEILPEKFTELVGTIKTILTKDVLPHETKELRKQIGQLRDYIDIFVYAYSTAKKDPILDIREQLDFGYENMGAYKDLFDIQDSSVEDAVYNEKEVNKSRKILLVWKKDLLDNQNKFLFVLSKSEKKIAKRSKKDLSQFYWGTSKMQPANDQSLLKTLRELSSDILHNAIDDYPSVIDIVNPATELKLAEEFHNFRKRMRTVVKLSSYDKNILSEVEVKDLELIQKNVDQFGKIQDLLTKMHHDSISLGEQIKIEWTQVVEWQKQNNFDEVLLRCLTSLKNHNSGLVK